MNTKFASKPLFGFTSFKIGADLTNIGNREFSLQPPLFSSIAHIVSLCAKKKVGWPNTWRVIAMVTNKKPIGDRAKMQFPRNTVC